MKFNYKSESFTTMAQCKREIALLKSELCKAFGVTREQIKIPNGLITFLWEHYRLICNVETK